jgi:biotin carboxylase
MKHNLKGKRLLLLAGTTLTLEAIQKAQEMGIWVAVTDYNKDTPAKRLANAAFDVSTTDLDALVQLCKEQKIDGVFTNWIDSMLPWGRKLCDRMGFPYPFSLEQIETYTEKGKFKNLCIKHNVPVPQQYSLENDCSDKGIERMKFPVIIKPVDSSGSRGITVCYSAENFRAGIEKALKYSRSGNVIIEQYIDGDEITVNYIIEDGNVILTSIHDRYFNTEQEGVLKTPDIYIYPSRYTKLYLEHIDPLVTKMLRATGLKNGSIFMQACVKDNNVYFYETGMRLNGCKIYQIVDAEHGYNALERLIQFAVTGSMGNPETREKITPYFKHWYSTISLLARPGTIGKIEGLDILETYPEIVGVTPWHFVGETITPDMRGTLPQTIVRISLKGNTKEELINSVEKVYDVVKVYDTNNENMLLTPHNTEELLGLLNYELNYLE